MRTAKLFLLADELGFTEAYVGEHVTDKGREHHLLHRLHRLARRRDETDQTRHLHHQHAERRIRLR